MRPGRGLAYEAVGVFAQRLHGADSRAQPQLEALLRGLRRGVRAPFERLPTVGGLRGRMYLCWIRVIVRIDARVMVRAWMGADGYWQIIPLYPRRVEHYEQLRSPSHVQKRSASSATWVQPR